jgi:hypothetical protein
MKKIKISLQMNVGVGVAAIFAADFASIVACEQ